MKPRWRPYLCMQVEKEKVKAAKAKDIEAWLYFSAYQLQFLIPMF